MSWAGAIACGIAVTLLALLAVSAGEQAGEAGLRGKLNDVRSARIWALGLIGAALVLARYA